MKGKCIVIGSGVLGLCAAMALPAATTLSRSDEAFLKMAAIEDMTEAHMGQVAENQGAVEGVKTFGQTLAKDHTQAYQDLGELAQKLGTSIPKGIDIGKDRANERVINMKGATFDEGFVQEELSSHRRAIAEFRREADHGGNADIRAYARQIIPVLEKHLQMAQDLSKTALKKTGSASRAATPPR